MMLSSFHLLSTATYVAGAGDAGETNQKSKTKGKT